MDNLPSRAYDDIARDVRADLDREINAIFKKGQVLEDWQLDLLKGLGIDLVGRRQEHVKSALEAKSKQSERLRRRRMRRIRKESRRKNRR